MEEREMRGRRRGGRKRRRGEGKRGGRGGEEGWEKKAEREKDWIQCM